MNNDIVKNKLGWRKGIPNSEKEIGIQRNSHKYFEYTMISSEGKIYKDTSIQRLAETIFIETNIKFLAHSCRNACYRNTKIKNWKITKQKIIPS